MKIKSFVFPVLYICLISLVVILLYFTTKQMNNDEMLNLKDITYVSSIILGDTIPVINTQMQIIYPYTSSDVEIKSYFYNIDDDLDKQQESIIFYNGTYLPNTGIDFTSINEFDVISILDGTVIDIKEDELMGKIVEVKHNNELVTSYAGLNEISVKKGEIVTQSTKLGTSGTNKLNESLGNHLHFEVYQNGINIDPLKVIGKKIDELGDF